MPEALDLYRQLYRIRCFEETVLENFPRGIFYGTTHTYLGQEANAVGVLTGLGEGDIVFSSHRCHGHFLAYGGDPFALFAELMGKPQGICAGRGGSQHLQWRNFYSNGVQGGIVPVATGMALAEKSRGSRSVVVVFMGDGTLGEGVIYEALNLAGLWSLPILYVLENNRIAQTTPIELAVAGEIGARFQAFGLQVEELDTSDVEEIAAAAGRSLAQVRQHFRPRALILHTARFGPHSKGDDTRSLQEIEHLRAARDPITLQAGRLDADQRRNIEQAVQLEIGGAFQRALESPSHSLPEEFRQVSGVGD
jgi:TPP-dependent pyruvate/acetoin dehydrogenase alpha subunit